MSDTSVSAEIVVLEASPEEVLIVTIAERGADGANDHGSLGGLLDDDHSQYHNDARGDARYAPLAHASDTANPHAVTAAQAGADATGTAASLIAAHEAAGDPHTGYALESSLGTAALLDVGTTANKVVQLDGTGKLPAVDGSQLTGLPSGGGASDHGALTGLADDDHSQYHNDARGDARYAPIAKGVTNGDTHDHAGGDGAQIAYSGLSGLPTLGTAAAAATGDFEASGAVSTHNAVSTAHGISAFGATLVDDADASTARSTLGLGTAATTASTAYATSTQGSNADSHAANTSNPHSVTAAQVGAPSGSGTSTGTNTGDSATPAETTTTIGALLNGATSKTTPVDADHIGLMDSAASNIWKKLSWANLKTALSSTFALLAGKAGGQTIIGGTGSGEGLTFETTSHATKGEFKFVGGTGTATLGSELVTNGSFTASLTGWTDSGSTWSWSAGTALHTAGTASTLSQNITVSNGSTYQLEFTIAGRTAGSVTITAGSVTANAGGTTAFTASSKLTFVAAASGAVALSVIPTSDFNGSITGITAKLVTLGSNTPGITVLNSSSVVVSSISANNAPNSAIGVNAQYSLTTGAYNNAIGPSAQFSLTTGDYNNAIGPSAQYNLTTGTFNNAIGYNAQRNLTTGTFNNAIGPSAQRNLTTGAYNSAIGPGAQYNLTTGAYNIAIGVNAQYSLTTGTFNIANGYNAQFSLTTGTYNNAIGSSAQYNLTTGTFNNAIGYNAQYSLTTGAYNIAIGSSTQRYVADGSTAATVFDSCTHIGNSARVSANSASNETAIGANAIGIGSNTVTFGDLNVTKTGLRGSVEILASSSTTAAQSQAGISASWVDSTHSTRKARAVLSAYDYSGGREALRFEADGTQIKLGFYGVTAVVKPTALTTQLTTLTYTAPGTPDYAVQALTSVGGFGFATEDEGHTVLSVIKNCQDRIAQLESKLQALGLLT